MYKAIYVHYLNKLSCLIKKVIGLKLYINSLFNSHIVSWTKIELNYKGFSKILKKKQKKTKKKKKQKQKQKQKTKTKTKEENNIGPINSVLLLFCRHKPNPITRPTACQLGIE